MGGAVKSIDKFSKKITKKLPLGKQSIAAVDKVKGVVAPALLGGLGVQDEPVTVDNTQPLQETPVMPTTDTEALAKARKKKLAQQLQRSGRSSTILSDSGDALGG